MGGYGGDGCDPPIVKAAQRGDLATVKKLVEAGGGSNNMEKRRENAMKTGKWTEESYSCNYSSKPSKSYGWSSVTAIAAAAYCGKAPVLRYLLETCVADPWVEGCPTDDVHYSAVRYRSYGYSSRGDGPTASDPECQQLIDVAVQYWQRDSAEGRKQGLNNPTQYLIALAQVPSASPLVIKERPSPPAECFARASIISMPPAEPDSVKFVSADAKDPSRAKIVVDLRGIDLTQGPRCINCEKRMGAKSGCTVSLKLNVRRPRTTHEGSGSSPLANADGKVFTNSFVDAYTWVEVTKGAKRGFKLEITLDLYRPDFTSGEDPLLVGGSECDMIVKMEKKYGSPYNKRPASATMMDTSSFQKSEIKLPVPKARPKPPAHPIPYTNPTSEQVTAHATAMTKYQQEFRKYKEQLIELDRLDELVLRRAYDTHFGRPLTTAASQLQRCLANNTATMDAQNPQETDDSSCPTTRGKRSRVAQEED